MHGCVLQLEIGVINIGYISPLPPPCVLAGSDLCPSYPTHVIVPICTGDLDFIRGAKQYHEGRFPNMTWYNQSNGAALLRAASTKDNRLGRACGLSLELWPRRVELGYI